MAYALPLFLQPLGGTEQGVNGSVGVRLLLCRLVEARGAQQNVGGAKADAGAGVRMRKAVAEDLESGLDQRLKLAADEFNEFGR
jgi:hypothetical protein